MTEPNQNIPATVPEQPEAKSPLKKGMPVVLVLVVIITLIGVANVSSLLSGNKKAAPASAMAMRPASPNAQQVNSFSTQQQVQAQRDAEERQHQQELAAAMQQLQAEQSIPGPEAGGVRMMGGVLTFHQALLRRVSASPQRPYPLLEICHFDAASSKAWG